MIPALFAQAAAGYNIVHLLIITLIVVAVVVIFLIGIRWMGVTIPPQLVQIFWVIVALIVCIVAIHIVVSMAW